MKKKSDFFKWLIWALSALFYFYEFVLRVSPSVMVEELMKSFDVTASRVGVLSAFFLYAYAPMQLPVGMIMDRYGVKKILSLASIICGIGAFLFALSSGFTVAGIGRLLIGGGSSFAFVAMIYITSHYFQAKKRALMIGIANSLAMLGASVGTGPLTVIIKNFGWRETINLFGIIGVVLGGVIYFVFKSNKEEDRIEQETAKRKSHFMENIKLVICQKPVWVNALVALLFYITTTAFAGLWGISFIQTVYNVDKAVAGYAISMVFIGWLVGGPLLGLCSDFIGKRTTVIRIGIVGTLLCLITVMYFPVIHIYVVYGLLFLIGLFSSAELLSFSLSIELNSFKARATAVAFTNFLISCGDAIVQPFIGFLLDIFWKGNTIQGIRVYSAKSYQVSLSCLPIALCLALVLLFFIKEKSFKNDVMPI